jgi:hypothetical protein
MIHRFVNPSDLVSSCSDQHRPKDADALHPSQGSSHSGQALTVSVACSRRGSIEDQMRTCEDVHSTTVVIHRPRHGEVFSIGIGSAMRLIRPYHGGVAQRIGTAVSDPQKIVRIPAWGLAGQLRPPRTAPLTWGQMPS